MTLRLTTLVLLLAFVLAHLSFAPTAVSGTQYIIQAFLPLNGTNPSQTRQWESMLRLAADQVSASWASSGDSLVVDVFDFGTNDAKALALASQAGQNSSVLALLGTGVQTATDAVAMVADYYQVRSLTDFVLHFVPLDLPHISPLSAH